MYFDPKYCRKTIRSQILEKVWIFKELIQINHIIKQSICVLQDCLLMLCIIQIERVLPLNISQLSSKF